MQSSTRRRVPSAQSGKTAQRSNRKRHLPKKNPAQPKSVKNTPQHSMISRLFSQLPETDGCGVAIFVAEGVLPPRKTRRSVEWMDKTMVEKVGRVGGVTLHQISRSFAALGHPVRLQLMRKLLSGPATYASLQRTSKLKAGPLYHHLSQLRLAQIILPKQRDLYELTCGGRNLILLALASSRMIRDARRRPVLVGE